MQMQLKNDALVGGGSMTSNAYIEKIRAYGDKIALADRGVTYSYARLTDEVDRFVEQWRDMLHPGAVVALLADYSFISIAAFLALIELKAVVVPITTSVPEEIAERLAIVVPDLEIRISIDGDMQCTSLAQSDNRHALITRIKLENHAGLILFSSGSTGKPKAMVHDLNNLLDVFVERSERNLVMMVFLMFDHIGGINTLLNSLATGAKLVFTPSRIPEQVCELIEAHGVNVLPASPTFLNLMLISGAQERYSMRSVKMITYGTESMPQNLLERIKSAFPRAKLLQTFGTSETGIAQTSSQSSTSTALKIDDPNLQYKVVDGELWLKSKTQVLGYINASMESFTDDGWFRTGDLVEATDDGYMKIIGRSKEVINVGGEKVLPVEVESVLLQMEGVADCMVYAEPNPITGQSVAADIVVRDGFDPKLVKKELQIFCRDKLDRYKIPARIVLVDKTNYGDRFKKMRLKK